MIENQGCCPNTKNSVSPPYPKSCWSHFALSFKRHKTVNTRRSAEFVHPWAWTSWLLLSYFIKSNRFVNANHCLAGVCTLTIIICIPIENSKSPIIFVILSSVLSQRSLQFVLHLTGDSDDTGKQSNYGYQLILQPPLARLKAVVLWPGPAKVVLQEGEK